MKFILVYIILLITNSEASELIGKLIDALKGTGEANAGANSKATSINNNISLGPLQISTVITHASASSNSGSNGNGAQSSASATAGNGNAAANANANSWSNGYGNGGAIANANANSLANSGGNLYPNNNYYPQGPIPIYGGENWGQFPSRPPGNKWYGNYPGRPGHPGNKYRPRPPYYHYEEHGHPQYPQYPQFGNAEASAQANSAGGNSESKADANSNSSGNTSSSNANASATSQTSHGGKTDANAHASANTGPHKGGYIKEENSGGLPGITNISDTRLSGSNDGDFVFPE